MKNKVISALITSLIAVSLLAGCSDSKTEETTEGTTAATTAEATTAEATEATTEATEATEATTEATEAKAGTATKDRAGNDIVIPDEINTIFSMAPSTTRFLIDLGLADKIVAVDTNSAAYAGSLSADVQYFDMMAPDNEAIVVADPDIVFTSGMSNIGGEDAFQPCRDAGICVADIPSSASFEAIAEDLAFIGSAVHEDEKTEAIIKDFNEQIAEYKKLGESITDKKTVLFEISLPTADYPTLYTLGKGTFLDEMITTVGCTNVTGDQESWIGISEEEAIALNPDVIITNVNYIDNVVDVILGSAGWENVTAIKDKAVYYIDADASNQPNQHVIDAMKEMAEQVYPDVFGAEAVADAA